MAKQRIRTNNAPTPGGPYSQALEVDGWVYVAGQVPIDPGSGEWVEDEITVQTERVLLNVKAILEAAGASLGDVVKTTVYMTDLDEFAAMNEVYAEFFNDESPPARATIEASNLPKGCKIEVDAVAKVGASES